MDQARTALFTCTGQQPLFQWWGCAHSGQRGRLVWAAIAEPKREPKITYFIIHHLTMMWLQPFSALWIALMTISHWSCQFAVWQYLHNWKVFPNWLASTVFRFMAVGEINSKESPAPKISLWFLWSLAEFAVKTSNCLQTLGTAFNLEVNVSCFCLTFHSFSTARPALVSVRDFPYKLCNLCLAFRSGLVSNQLLNHQQANKF